MREEDSTHYRRRAEAELHQAQRATTPKAVQAHCDLANAWRERVASEEPCRERV